MIAGLDLSTTRIGYADPDTHVAWGTWQAAWKAAAAEAASGGSDEF